MARDKSVPEQQTSGGDKVGLFGGLFNPPHLGHLAGAQEVLTELQLSKIYFIPTYKPPHRESAAISPGHRLEMIRRATRENPKFEVSRLEYERGDTSFTVDTVEEYLAANPDTRPCLIVGADELISFTEWHRWSEILELVQLVGMNRPGFKFDRIPAEVKTRAQLIEIPELKISSRNLRKRAKAEENIRYLVPETVYKYIQSEQLYGFSG